MDSSAYLGFDLKNLQFRLFFTIVAKIAYTCNSNHSNNNNFICVRYRHNFACIVGFSGSANSNMLSKFVKGAID